MDKVRDGQEKGTDHLTQPSSTDGAAEALPLTIMLRFERLFKYP